MIFIHISGMDCLNFSQQPFTIPTPMTGNSFPTFPLAEVDRRIISSLIINTARPAAGLRKYEIKGAFSRCQRLKLNPQRLSGDFVVKHIILRLANATIG